MRILHVIYDHTRNPWVGGGGATRTLEICGRIAEKGHRVLVVCGNYPGAPRTSAYGHLRYRHVGYSRSYILSRITFMLVAAYYIRRGGYDLAVEDVSPFSPIGAPAWKRQVPHVASVQNLLGMHATQKYGMLGWGPRIVEKELLQMYHNFVAVSPGIAEQIESTLSPKAVVRVIPNSCNPIFFRESSRESECEEHAPEGEERGPYILSLGRIDVYQKGLDDLVNAFDRLAERLPGIRLLIAGSGTTAHLEMLRGLIAAAHNRDRIELLGQVDQGRAARLMKRALLVAIPSRYEGWPLAALEAGAVGVPVVGTDIVGVRDAAPQFPEGHGELVPQGDIAGLTRSLYRVAVDEKLRAEMAERGHRWAKGFTWDKLADEQLAFYRNILHASRQKRSGAPTETVSAAINTPLNDAGP